MDLTVSYDLQTPLPPLQRPVHFSFGLVDSVSDLALDNVLSPFNFGFVDPVSDLDVKRLGSNPRASSFDSSQMRQNAIASYFFFFLTAMGIGEHAGALLLSDPSLEFAIKTEWDGTPYTKECPVKINIDGVDKIVRLQVDAPLYNDTAPPNGQKGLPYPKLYDYQVVEAFFLNDDDQYLEVELSPHGEHLVLLLNGRKNNVVQQLPLRYYSKNDGKTWTGYAYVPLEYFPPKVTKFNAYAIHGEGQNRVYLSLYPAPKGKFQQPDFHRLEYFQPIDMNRLPPFYGEDTKPSNLWSLFPPRKH